MKRFLVVTAVLLAGIVVLAGYIIIPDGFDIKVKNQTNKEVSGLYLTYENIKADKRIPPIASGEEFMSNNSLEQ